IVTDLDAILIILKAWTVITEAGKEEYFQGLVNLQFCFFNVLTNLPIEFIGVYLKGCYGAGCANSTIQEKVILFQIITTDGELREYSDEIDFVEMNAVRISFVRPGL
ncbi:15453_t:CDS:2, partial [Gigaspora rosea]